MIINIATVVVCFFMLVIFRRMDKASAQKRKLRLYAEKVSSDFKKTTVKSIRELEAAKTEIDIAFKNSKAVAKNLHESAYEIKTRMKTLELERKNLKKVDDDLRIISGAAKDVNKQIDYIAKAKSDFGELSRSVGLLHENLNDLSGEMNSIFQSFDAKLERRENEIVQSSQETISRLVDEFGEKMNDLESRVSESENILVENFKVKISPLIKTVENAEILNQKLNNLQDNFSAMEDNFFEEFQSKINDMKSEVEVDFDKLKERIQNVNQSIEESRSKLVQSFGEEVSKVRAELDTFDIHAVSKQDEIVKATRSEAEKINKKIGDFEERFLELEGRIIDTAESKMDGIDSEYQNAEMRMNNLLSKISDEESRMEQGFELLESRLDGLREEIMKYEQNHDVFGRADELMQKIKEFEKFASQLDQIRDIKKTADREVREFMSSKSKLVDVGSEIKGLLEANDQAVKTTENLFDKIAEVDSVRERIDSLAETYNLLDRQIDELRHYEDQISRNLDSVKKTENLMRSIDSRVTSSESAMNRYDKKLESMGKQINRIQEDTLLLKTKENDILEVSERLDSIESMSEILDERVKQIKAMLSKVEGIQQEIDRSDSKLQKMYDATDQKMRELSDFIQAVDNNSPIVKQVKGNLSNGVIPGKNLNDSMVRTVRELSDKGWDPESISRKLMIDENSIRFIINTMSL